MREPVRASFFGRLRPGGERAGLARRILDRSFAVALVRSGRSFSPRSHVAMVLDARRTSAVSHEDLDEIDARREAGAARERARRTQEARVLDRTQPAEAMETREGRIVQRTSWRGYEDDARRLDLDAHERGSVVRDDVDFGVRGAHAASMNREPVSEQCAHGQLFTQLAELVRVGDAQAREEPRRAAQTHAAQIGREAHSSTPNTMVRAEGSCELERARRSPRGAAFAPNYAPFVLASPTASVTSFSTLWIAERVKRRRVPSAT